MKHEDGASMASIAVKHRGGVYLQPALVDAGQFELEAAHHRLLLDSASYFVQFLQTKGFHDCLPAHVFRKPKKALERLINEVNAPGRIENENSFGHAVKQRLLLGLLLHGELLVFLVQRAKRLLLLEKLPGQR